VDGGNSPAALIAGAELLPRDAQAVIMAMLAKVATVIRFE